MGAAVSCRSVGQFPQQVPPSGVGAQPPGKAPSGTSDGPPEPMPLPGSTPPVPAGTAPAPASTAHPTSAGPTLADRGGNHAIHRGTIELTHAADVYVRSGPGTLVLGQLQRGERFEVSALSDDGRWAWGYAGGDAARTGWVNIGAPTRSPWTQVDSTPDVVAGRPHDSTADYQPYVTGREKRDGLTFTRRANVLDPATAKLYGNYSPERGPSDELPTDFSTDPHVGVRFSPDPGWVVVLRGVHGTAEQHPQWALMRRSDLEVQPDADYEAWQERRGVTDAQMWGEGPVAGD